MTHVLVLADDACIQSTCVEILARMGFRVSAAAPDATAPGSPDVILLWESDHRADCLSAVRQAYAKVPIILCTWEHRRPWPEADAVVSLPFNVERVASALLRTLKHSRTLAA